MHFRKSDVDNLAEKLRILCDNPDIVYDLKKGADEYILNKYNWNDVADATSGLYKKVLKNKRKVAYVMKGFTFNSKTIKNIKVLKLFLISLIFAAIAVSIAIIGCNYIGNRNFRETFYSVSSLKVNSKIRIVQISDLHNCSYGKNNSKLEERVAKLNPDIIIYTGDMIEAKTKSNDRVLSLCKNLAGVAPSFYIYGNNEVKKYYDVRLNQEELDKKFGFNDDNRKPDKLLKITDELEKALEKRGVKVLKNETETISVGTTPVDIYGVLTSNPSSFWSYAGESFDDYIYNNKTHLKVTAIHEPLVFEEYTPDSWGDLLLAGHNHGGTLKIPVLGPLYTHDGGIFPDRGGHYVSGRYEVQDRPLVISTGLDNKNLFRINNKPEIVIVDVNKF